MAEFEKNGNIYDFGQDDDNDLSCFVQFNGEKFRISTTAETMRKANEAGKKAKSSENEQAFDSVDEILLIALGDEQFKRFKETEMSVTTFGKVVSVIIAKVSGQSDTEIEKIAKGAISKERKK